MRANVPLFAGTQAVQFLKNFYQSFFRRETSVAQNVLEKREKLTLLKLQNLAALPDVDSPFNLNWTMAHDDEFDEILLFEFRAGIDNARAEHTQILHRELAFFEDYSRAKELISAFASKYGERIEEIRLGPGVGVYIDGARNSGFENFTAHVCNLGYELIDPDLQSVRHDGATREIFVPETTFKLRES